MTKIFGSSESSYTTPRLLTSSSPCAAACRHPKWSSSQTVIFAALFIKLAHSLRTIPNRLPWRAWSKVGVRSESVFVYTRVHYTNTNRCFARPPDEFESAGPPRFQQFNKALLRLHQDNPKVLWEAFGICYHTVVSFAIYEPACSKCKADGGHPSHSLLITLAPTFTNLSPRTCFIS
jgi:hypothetical protein